MRSTAAARARASPPRSRAPRTTWQAWMLDGRMLRGLTGTPMRRSLGEAHWPRPSPSRDVGELDDEVVDRLMRFACAGAACGAWVTIMRTPAASRARGCGMRPGGRELEENFCMSQAPVGQRSAHSPVRTRPRPFRHDAARLERGRDVDACSRSCAGAFSLARAPLPRRLAVNVMQSTGQMSTHASPRCTASARTPSPHRSLRQRCASLKASCGSKRARPPGGCP